MILRGLQNATQSVNFMKPTRIITAKENFKLQLICNGKFQNKELSHIIQKIYNVTDLATPFLSAQ